MRVSYECTRGHVTEVYKGINDPSPKRCSKLSGGEHEKIKTCGAKLEWVPEPVNFTIK